MWEIIDDDGTVYSGDEEDMRNTFYEIIEGSIELDWNGDLRLIEIHDVYR